MTPMLIFHTNRREPFATVPEPGEVLRTGAVISVIPNNTPCQLYFGGNVYQPIAAWRTVLDIAYGVIEVEPIVPGDFDSDVPFLYYDPTHNTYFKGDDYCTTEVDADDLLRRRRKDAG